MEIETLPNKINSVLDSIDEYIADTYLTCYQIGKRVAHDNYIPFLNLCILFYYTLGQSMYSYIRARKLDIASSYLPIDDDPYLTEDVTKALKITEYSQEFVVRWMTGSGFIPQRKVHLPISDNSTTNKTSIDFSDHFQNSYYGHFELYDLRPDEQSYYDQSSDYLKKKSTSQYIHSPSVSNSLELEAFFVLPKPFNDHAYYLNKHSSYSLLDCYYYSFELKEWC